MLPPGTESYQSHPLSQFWNSCILMTSQHCTHSSSQRRRRIGYGSSFSLPFAFALRLVDRRRVSAPLSMLSASWTLAWTWPHGLPLGFSLSLMDFQAGLHCLQPYLGLLGLGSRRCSSCTSFIPLSLDGGRLSSGFSSSHLSGQKPPFGELFVEGIQGPRSMSAAIAPRHFQPQLLLCHYYSIIAASWN